MFPGLPELAVALLLMDGKQAYSIWTNKAPKSSTCLLLLPGFSFGYWARPMSDRAHLLRHPSNRCAEAALHMTHLHEESKTGHSDTGSNQ